MSTNKVYGNNPNFLPLVEKKIDGKLKILTNLDLELMSQCLLIIALIVF